MIVTLAFAKGAVFDYEEIVAHRELDRDKVRKSITPTLVNEEENAVKRVYIDPDSGKELLLFIARGYDFGCMRLWIVRGVCERSDYDEDMEKEGLIREWLNVEIE